MFGRKIVLVSAAAILLAVLLAGQLMSQEAPPAGRGGGRGTQADRPRGQRMDPNQMQRQRMDPNQMQRMMTERYKGMLGATDAEWKVIEPKLTKVLTLSRQAGGMGGMRMPGMGRERAPGEPGTGPGEGARVQTEVDKAVEALRTALDNKESKPEAIKEKLAAMRAAREKVKQELTKAQQDLRQGLNLRQEAQLVLSGVLN